MAPEDLFRRISSLLERADIPYMLTGSFASSVYGMNRGSADIDFVIAADVEWAKLGKSSRQIEDVAGILKVRADELDVPYIEKWVSELGLSSEWARARQAADLE